MWAVVLGVLVKISLAVRQLHAYQHPWNRLFRPHLHAWWCHQWHFECPTAGTSLPCRWHRLWTANRRIFAQWAEYNLSMDYSHWWTSVWHRIAWFLVDSDVLMWNSPAFYLPFGIYHRICWKVILFITVEWLCKAINWFEEKGWRSTYSRMLSGNLRLGIPSAGANWSKLAM